ncbi:hypothetical protein FA95DRAFT_1546637 [Auriscalpium vulgare]|uniref:Uncharacterized protein n=1 Tax=Auriscalpium vulgare TaxID=40419 RepID=A0ACB8RG81_9AGAM|nr:hypothetical protein FA95DRAFT_1546637 [Auriscalpium vulgare]
MEDDDATNARDPDRWEHLLEEQTAIFRSTITRNAALAAEVEELRRELSVWKGALKTADETQKTDKKTIARLERNIEALKDDNPLLICLIDGDGTIFSEELWRLGTNGGRQAALMLTKGITDHAASADKGVASRCQTWLSIFCNKSGLMDVLLRNSICSIAQFEDFLQGFSQASPLFSVVDVGNGKEAADAKIKEYLRVFTRFPQTTRVYFGGAHDNGYFSTLTFLENEGLLGKVVLLRGYKDVAFELKNIDIAHLEVAGLFMMNKLQTNPHRKSPTATPPAHVVQLQDFDKFKNRSRTTSKERPTKSRQPQLQTSSSSTAGEVLDPTRSIYKQNLSVLPCTFFHLSHCNTGEKCRYRHDYVLAPRHVEELQAHAKKMPCPHVKNDKSCPDGDDCILGHVCPKLSKCGFVKSGSCKFTGKDAHKDPPGKPRGIRKVSASDRADSPDVSQTDDSASQSQSPDAWDAPAASVLNPNAPSFQGAYTFN